MDFSKNNYPTTAQLHPKADMTMLSLGWIWVADRADGAAPPISQFTPWGSIDDSDPNHLCSYRHPPLIRGKLT